MCQECHSGLLLTARFLLVSMTVTRFSCPSNKVSYAFSIFILCFLQWLIKLVSPKIQLIKLQIVAPHICPFLSDMTRRNHNLHSIPRGKILWYLSINSITSYWYQYGFILNLHSLVYLGNKIKEDFKHMQCNIIVQTIKNNEEIEFYPSSIIRL